MYDRQTIANFDLLDLNGVKNSILKGSCFLTRSKVIQNVDIVHLFMLHGLDQNINKLSHDDVFYI